MKSVCVCACVQKAFIHKSNIISLIEVEREECITNSLPLTRINTVKTLGHAFNAAISKAPGAVNYKFMHPRIAIMQSNVKVHKRKYSTL